uniref:AT-rich interactive domain-containing protein 3 n=1 Tax=Coturnix japonica TaxID=93934 RepID=A0A8C2SZA3_COTJA
MVLGTRSLWTHRDLCSASCCDTGGSGNPLPCPLHQPRSRSCPLGNEARTKVPAVSPCRGAPQGSGSKLEALWLHRGMRAQSPLLAAAARVPGLNPCPIPCSPGPWGDSTPALVRFGGAGSALVHLSPSSQTAAPGSSVSGLRGGGEQREQIGAVDAEEPTAALGTEWMMPSVSPSLMLIHAWCITDPSHPCPQLYELDEDPKRKEFLDDLFSFMQKRGTPVNRIPIMAKQVLDLYMLYRLVTEKGGLVEVINKKIWREITKGLNLPTSITSAAFTLRTQYMKYLYPYECEKRALSSPGELQAAIDSNRREGRRQTFGTALFNYSPTGTPTLLGSPKIPLPGLSISTHSCSQISQVHGVKKEDGTVPGRITIPVGLSSHHLTAAQVAAASQAAVLEQLREKLEAGEPPEKKVSRMTEEEQRLMQHALQHNLLAVASQFPMNIRVSNRGNDRQETALNLSTNGISSINMSIEINGVVYTVAPSAGDTSSPQLGGGGLRWEAHIGDTGGTGGGGRAENGGGAYWGRAVGGT